MIKKEAIKGLGVKVDQKTQTVTADYVYPQMTTHGEYTFAEVRDLGGGDLSAGMKLVCQSMTYGSESPRILNRMVQKAKAALTSVFK
jgi:hypothetical protein